MHVEDRPFSSAPSPPVEVLLFSCRHLPAVLAVQGIGLCRTEHMFFASEERIATVRRMIVAQVGGAREGAGCGLQARERAASPLGAWMRTGVQWNGIAASRRACHAQRCTGPRCPASHLTGLVVPFPAPCSPVPPQTKEARLKALADLLPFQRADFEVGNQGAKFKDLLETHGAPCLASMPWPLGGTYLARAGLPRSAGGRKCTFDLLCSAACRCKGDAMYGRLEAWCVGRGSGWAPSPW